MNQQQFFDQVNAILWEDWDPIGMNDTLGVRDEYRSYVASIVKLLSEHADEHKLTKLLHHHANVNMGLSTELEDHRETAGKLRSLMR